MTSQYVPRPAGILGPPWSRTEYTLMGLMNDERNMQDQFWVKHAQVCITYLEGRLEVYDAARRPPQAPLDDDKATPGPPNPLMPSLLPERSGDLELS